MKRIILICLVALFLLPGMAMAHSKVTESTPAKDEKVTAAPAEISITFNTDIEKLSSFKLMDETGNQIKTSEVAVDAATMSGTVTEPLKNGAYTVKWTIIGADGHAVNGEYGFTVDAAEAAATPTPAASESPSPAPDETQAPDAVQSDSPDPSDEPTPTAVDAEDHAGSGENGSNTVTWIVAAVVIVAAAAFFLNRRGRK